MTTKNEGVIQQALSDFDRWRVHYDLLLACWLDSHHPQHQPHDKCALAQKLAGAVRGVLSRRLGPVMELHYLREIASSCSNNREGKGAAEAYVKAGLDLVGFLTAHEQHEEAEPLIASLAEFTSDKWVPDHPLRIFTMMQVAQSHLGRGNVEKVRTR